MFLFKILFFVSSFIYADNVFYPADYDQARDVFRERSQSLKKLLFDKAEIGYFEVETNLEKKLTIDYTYIPQESKKKTHLLILTSGVHGAEAFTGSAIQNQFLKQLNLHPEWAHKTGFLIVHSVNPYGFYKNRRVTENNVDLNRNFTEDEKLFQSERPEYEKLNEFLNPKDSLTYSLFSIFRLYTKSIFLLLKHGRQTLANAILGGQYSFPKGIYYGGKKTEENAAIMKRLFIAKSKKYKNIFHIDLHTGFGERGKLHFFTTNDFPQKILKARETLFSGYSIDTGDQKNFYKISGEFTSFTTKILKNKTVIPMTFEFGTSDSQTTAGALFSLRTSIYENQAFHYGVHNEDGRKRVQEDFSELFNPPDPLWRKKVLHTAKETLKVLIDRFALFPNLPNKQPPAAKK